MDKKLFKSTQDELNKIKLNLSAKNFSSIGLLRGISGFNIFLGELYQLEKDPEYIEKLNQEIESTISAIGNNSQVEFGSSSGLAGWAWSLAYLKSIEMIDFPRGFLKGIDHAAIEEVVEKISTQDYDPLHGSIGLGLYLLKRKKRKVVSKIIHSLNDSKIEDEFGIKWIKNRYKVDEVIDLGLAHGIIGILYFLSKCYKEGVNKRISKTLINGVIKYLKSIIQDFSQAGSFFPNSIRKDFTEVTPSKSRLAWCYGDLTILYTLFQTAIIIQDEELKKSVIARLIITAKRDKESENFVEDSVFCHGTSGIAHLYNKLWKQTQQLEFRNASLYWLQETINANINNSNAEGYKFMIRNNNKEKIFNLSSGLLEGICGVGLVYISFLTKGDSNWDECLLL